MFNDDEKWAKRGDRPFTKAKRSNRDVFDQNELQTYASLEKMLHNAIHVIRQLKKKGNTNTSSTPKQQRFFRELSEKRATEQEDDNEHELETKRVENELETKRIEPIAKKNRSGAEQRKTRPENTTKRKRTLKLARREEEQRRRQRAKSLPASRIELRNGASEPWQREKKTRANFLSLLGFAFFSFSFTYEFISSKKQGSRRKQVSQFRRSE
ncbi:hypothetical protein F2Q68_00007500 [Brassica cretica]|uniref:Uncharacterized protein n=1 Tax=Brassica cretica TaxID=69181 RepID=A0A8S9KQK5_BRACR|nr:hypothetical protein F2Q68_00007500 [Brassica cretica]